MHNVSFQFVENSKIDGAARKLIRSHVMKGKNVGKIRPRTTRKRQEEVPFSHDTYEAKKLSTGCPCKSTEDKDNMIIPIPRTIGNSLSSFTFPCEMQPYMRNLIYQFFAVTAREPILMEYCLSVDIMRSIWFQYLLSDEAFFYSVLAVSEMSADSLLGKQETSPRALQHLSNAYRCIYRSIQTHMIPPDPTIASVVSMAIHEDLRGHPGRSKVHMDALQRMVEIRGGIAQFTVNRVLCLKICKADIEYALQTCSYPCFYRDEFPRETIETILGQAVAQTDLFSALDAVGVYSPELRCVAADLMRVCYLLNNCRTYFKLEPYAFQEIWTSVSYRLLYRYPLAGGRPEKDSENAWHLGLLALATTFLFRSGHFQRLSYDLLAERFRDAIQATSTNDQMKESTFVLWLLFIGAVSVFGAKDRSWLLPQVKRCLISLNIDNWRTARKEMRRFPWIDVAHDEAGHELWQAMDSE